LPMPTPASRVEANQPIGRKGNKMAQYKKKAVVIDAWGVGRLIYDAGENWKGLPESIRAEYDKGNIVFRPDSMEIKTLEGTMKAEYGDMLIRGVKGEFYPCKPDIFAATYEYFEPQPSPSQPTKGKERK